MHRWLDVNLSEAERAAAVGHKSSSLALRSIASDAIKRVWPSLVGSDKNAIPAQALYCVRIKGCNHSGLEYLPNVMRTPVLNVACQHTYAKAVLFWRWNLRRCSLHLWGLFLPHRWLSMNLTSMRSALQIDLGRALLRDGTAEDLPKEPPALPFSLYGVSPVRAKSKATREGRMEKAFAETYGAFAEAWICQPPPANSAHQPSDGVYSLPDGNACQMGEFRADQALDYREVVQRIRYMMTCMNPLQAEDPHANLRRDRRSLDLVIVIDALQSDLRQADTRLVDLLGRTTTLILSLHLLIQEQQARLQADKPRYGIHSLQGIHAFGHIRALACMFWLRHRFLYAYDETAILRSLQQSGYTLMVMRLSFDGDWTPVISAIVTEEEGKKKRNRAQEAPTVTLPFPTSRQAYDELVCRELVRFVRQYRTSGHRVPTMLYFVPIDDMDHDSPVPLANETRHCLYTLAHPVLGAPCKCTTCDPIVRYQDRKGNLWQCIHYLEVPMWQLGRSLRLMRNLYQKLRRETADAVPMVDAVAQWAARVGLKSIWAGVWTDYMASCRDGNRGLSAQAALKLNEALIEQDLLEYGAYIVSERRRWNQEKQRKQPRKPKAIDIWDNNSNSQPAKIQDETIHLEREDLQRIRDYIGLDPADFYAPFKGTDYRQTGKTIRWGERGAFSVVRVACVTPRYTIRPGDFCDFSGGLSGDPFKFIMIHRYGTEQRVLAFRSALLFCYAWVIRKYGPDCLAINPLKPVTASVDVTTGFFKTSQTTLEKLPGITAQLAKMNAVVTAPAIRSPAEEMDPGRKLAHKRWREAQRLSSDKPQNPVVEYLRKARNIHSARFLFHSDAVRYHTCYPLCDDDVNLQYPAMVSRFVDPVTFLMGSATNEQQLLQAVQGTFLDLINGGKAKALIDPKKTRGAAGGHFVPIQVYRPKEQPPKSNEPGLFRTVRVAVCEGVETAASVAEACPELEVWASGGITNLGQFPLLDKLGEREIIYCADRDSGEAGVKRMDTQREYLCASGWRVHVRIPDVLPGREGVDFNDILMVVQPRNVALAQIRTIILGQRTVYEPSRAIATSMEWESPMGSVCADSK